MIKRISAFLIAITILSGMTACSMPQNIFEDQIGISSDDKVEDYKDSIYDFNFVMEDQHYSLPAEYSSFESKGWSFINPLPDETDDADGVDGAEPVDNSNVSLEAGQYSDYFSVYKDKYKIEVKFYNDSDDAAALSNCKVVGVRVDALGSVAPFTQLAGDIKIGSTYDEIVKICGEPSFEKEVLSETETLAKINDIDFDTTLGKKTKSACYKVDEHAFVEFIFGIVQDKDDSVAKLVIENDVEPDRDYDYSKDRKKVPDAIKLYKEPDLLGKAVSDFSFKYDDNLYTLPIPVSELVDDGWKFARGAYLRVQRGTTADGVILHKDNVFVSVMVHNYDTKNVQTPINCYAVSLSVGVTGPYTKVMLPKGVSLGTDKDTLIEAYGDASVVIGEADNANEQNSDNINTPNQNDFVTVTETEEYSVYSYVMKDDVPSVEIPVSISDIGDTGKSLLGSYRKHIDVYVSNINQKVVYIYMQNCPEFIVDEAAIWAEQLEKANQD